MESTKTNNITAENSFHEKKKVCKAQLTIFSSIFLLRTLILQIWRKNFPIFRKLKLKKHILHSHLCTLSTRVAHCSASIIFSRFSIKKPWLILVWLLQMGMGSTKLFSFHDLKIPKIPLSYFAVSLLMWEHFFFLLRLFGNEFNGHFLNKNFSTISIYDQSHLT